jgi:hypothetical protein
MAYINSEYAFVVDPNADGEGPSPYDPSADPGAANGGGYGGKGGGGYGGKGSAPAYNGKGSTGGMPSYADSYANGPTPFYGVNFGSHPPPAPAAPAHPAEAFAQVPGAYVPTAADLAAFEIQNVTTYDSKSGQPSGTAKVASLKDPSILENNDVLTGSFDDMVNQLSAIYSTAILHNPLTGEAIYQTRTDAAYDPNSYNETFAFNPYDAVDFEDHAALLAALTAYTNEFPTLRGYILDHIPGGRISYDSKSGQTSGQLPPGSTKLDYLKNYVNFMRDTVSHPEWYYADELKRVAYDMGYDKNKDFTNAEIQSFVQPALRYLSAELVQKFVSEAYSKGAKDRAEDDSFFGLGKEFGIIAAVVLSLTGAGAAIGGLITGASASVSSALASATIGNVAVGGIVNGVIGNIVVGTILNGGDFGAAVKGAVIGGVANFAGGLAGGFAQGAAAGVEGISANAVGLIASTGAQITTSALLNGGSVGDALMRGGVSLGIATVAGGVLGDGGGTGPNLTTGVANLVTQQIFDGRIDPISAAMAFAPTGRVAPAGAPATMFDDNGNLMPGVSESTRQQYNGLIEQGLSPAEASASIIGVAMPTFGSGPENLGSLIANGDNQVASSTYSEGRSERDLAFASGTPTSNGNGTFAITDAQGNKYTLASDQRTVLSADLANGNQAVVLDGAEIVRAPNGDLVSYRSADGSASIVVAADGTRHITAGDQYIRETTNGYRNVTTSDGRSVTYDASNRVQQIAGTDFNDAFKTAKASGTLAFQYDKGDGAGMQWFNTTTKDELSAVARAAAVQQAQADATRAAAVEVLNAGGGRGFVNPPLIGTQAFAEQQAYIAQQAQISAARTSASMAQSQQGLAVANLSPSTGIINSIVNYADARANEMAGALNQVGNIAVNTGRVGVAILGGREGDQLIEAVAAVPGKIANAYMNIQDRINQADGTSGWVDPARVLQEGFRPTADGIQNSSNQYAQTVADRFADNPLTAPVKIAGDIVGTAANVAFGGAVHGLQTLQQDPNNLPITTATLAVAEVASVAALAAPLIGGGVRSTELVLSQVDNVAGAAGDLARPSGILDRGGNLIREGEFVGTPAPTRPLLEIAGDRPPMTPSSAPSFAEDVIARPVIPEGAPRLTYEPAPSAVTAPSPIAPTMAPPSMPPLAAFDPPPVPRIPASIDVPAAMPPEVPRVSYEPPPPPMAPMPMAQTPPVVRPEVQLAAVDGNPNVAVMGQFSVLPVVESTELGRQFVGSLDSGYNVLGREVQNALGFGMAADGAYLRPNDLLLNSSIERLNQALPIDQPITLRFYSPTGSPLVESDVFLNRFVDNGEMPLAPVSMEARHDISTHTIAPFVFPQELTDGMRARVGAVRDLVRELEVSAPSLTQQLVPADRFSIMPLSTEPTVTFRTAVIDDLVGRSDGFVGFNQAVTQRGAEDFVGAQVRTSMQLYMENGISVVDYVRHYFSGFDLGPQGTATLDGYLTRLSANPGNLTVVDPAAMAQQAVERMDVLRTAVGAAPYAPTGAVYPEAHYDLITGLYVNPSTGKPYSGQ